MKLTKEQQQKISSLVLKDIKNSSPLLWKFYGNSLRDCMIRSLKHGNGVDKFGSTPMGDLNGTMFMLCISEPTFNYLKELDKNFAKPVKGKRWDEVLPVSCITGNFDQENRICYPIGEPISKKSCLSVRGKPISTRIRSKQLSWEEYLKIKTVWLQNYNK